MRFLFACGGTAGHINPALAVAGRLREIFPDAEFKFVGANGELENRLVPAAGYELVNIDVYGLSRSHSMRAIKYNIKVMEKLNLAIHESAGIIDSFKPDLAVGTGGYVCYPVLRVAARRGIPTVIHESNAVPGLTTRLVSGSVDRVLAAFPSVAAHCKRPDRVVLTGTPVREDFLKLTRGEAKRKLGLVGKPLTVSFWGSLGAERMNGMMADFIRLNSRSGEMLHIHATGGGEEGREAMMERLRAMDLHGLPDWEDVEPYIDNMGLVMAAADLILCRAGASTLAEITALGRASVLVPSPNVTNDQQTKNARELERAGGALVLTEEGLTGEKLYNTAVTLLRDRDRLRRLEDNARTLGVTDASTRICGEILALLEKKGGLQGK